MVLILCDRQKGLDACHDLYPLVRFGRCAKHLLDNAKENFPGKISQEWQQAFWGMAKAPTEASYLAFYNVAKGLSPKPTEYVNNAKAEFAEHVFQKEGIRRFGDSTSNMAEQFFSAMSKKEFKELPIIQLHQKILIWQSQRFYEARGHIANLGVAEITPFMKHVLENKYWSAKSSSVVVTLLNATPNVVLASVQISKASPVRVLEVELQQFPPSDRNPNGITSAKCTCGWYSCLGRPCKHVLIVMRMANAKLKQDFWYHLDARWLHKSYHFSTWKKQYETGTFPSTAIEFVAADRQQLLPPPIDKKKGRKGKDNKPYEQRPDQKRVVKCHGCGKAGHFRKTCPEPNAKRLVESLQDDEEVVNRFSEDGDEELDPSTTSAAANAGEAVRSVEPVVVTQIINALNDDLTGRSARKVRRIVIETIDIDE